jgi:hypothetical protein
MGDRDLYTFMTSHQWSLSDFALVPATNSDYGTKLTVCLNIAYWPAAAAIERKDWRAIRWLSSLTLLERVALSSYPVWIELKKHLASLALAKPTAQNWEFVLWAAYQLKDCPLLAAIESHPLNVGMIREFGEVSVRVNRIKLEQWRENWAAHHRK